MWLQKAKWYQNVVAVKKCISLYASIAECQYEIPGLLLATGVHHFFIWNQQCKYDTPDVSKLALRSTKLSNNFYKQSFFLSVWEINCLYFTTLGMSKSSLEYFVEVGKHLEFSHAPASKTVFFILTAIIISRAYNRLSKIFRK